MDTGGRAIPVSDDATVLVDSNAMTATLEWSAATNDMVLMCSAAQTACEAAGIRLGEGKTLVELITAASESDGKFRTTIVRGRPALPPVHGRLEWLGNFFESGFAVDPRTGQLDYRNRIQQANVAEGQKLARVHPPQEGAPGVDVFGNVVAPEKPQRVTLRAGLNVSVDESAMEYTAACAGRLRFSNNMLFVDEVLIVHGSIGLETGHVRHPGALQVEQDIEEGTEVEADGDIEVHGVIEGAVVRAGGNIYVRGGISGEHHCSIKARGTVRAKYVRNAEIEAQGNVEVEREIDQSVIHSRGAVLIPQGRIVGGAIVACAGIAAGQLGTDASVPTEVTTGVDFMLARELGALATHADELAAALARVTATIDAALQAEARLSAQQREAVTVLMVRQADLQQEIQQCRERAAELEAESTARRKYCIVVQSRLCQDVVLDIGGCRTRTRQEVQGPLRVVLRNDEIDVVPIATRNVRTPLKATA